MKRVYDGGTGLLNMGTFMAFLVGIFGINVILLVEIPSPVCTQKCRPVLAHLTTNIIKYPLTTLFLEVMISKNDADTVIF